VFELLLAALLGWGSFAPVPFGTTISLLLLGTAARWLCPPGAGVEVLQHELVHALVHRIRLHHPLTEIGDKRRGAHQ